MVGNLELSALCQKCHLVNKLQLHFVTLQPDFSIGPFLPLVKCIVFASRTYVDPGNSFFLFLQQFDCLQELHVIDGSFEPYNNHLKVLNDVIVHLNKLVIDRWHGIPWPLGGMEGSRMKVDHIEIAIPRRRRLDFLCKLLKHTSTSVKHLNAQLESIEQYGAWNFVGVTVRTYSSFQQHTKILSRYSRSSTTWKFSSQKKRMFQVTKSIRRGCARFCSR
jgi:hypothetical protein